MSASVVSRPEAQARRLLAAYPWRMRAEQGDEIVATVLDTLSPGATRLPWRTAVDLVRGGLRTRRQRRPPFLTWLAYHLGWRIHPRWIWWVYDDLEDPNFRRRYWWGLGVLVMAEALVLVPSPGCLPCHSLFDRLQHVRRLCGITADARQDTAEVRPGFGR